MTDLTRRDIGFGMLSASLLASAARGIAAAPGPAAPRTDDLSHVDPELRAAAVAATPLTDALARISPTTLKDIRVSLGTMVPPADPSVKFTKRMVPGSNNQPDVPVYVINDRPGTRRPVIVHTHGGGFVLGSVLADMPRLQRMAAALDCVIVSIEYRLAPEVRYTGSVEDNYTALKWVFANADALGVDRARIAVMGESAGGGHAALLAIKARDRGEVPILFQLLVYPMLDDRTASIDAVPPHIGRIIWTAPANRFGWGAFLGVAPGGASVPHAAVPARTADLGGLPPTYICVGAIDLFVNENIKFASRLIDAGVATELRVVPGAFHGFDVGSPEARVVQTFNAAKLDALRKAFAIA